MLRYVRYVLAIAILIYLTHGFLPTKEMCSNNKCYTLPNTVSTDLSPLSRSSFKPLPEVVLGPGGVAGFYSLGICHYVLNHFEIRDKSTVGFSAGSFTLLFMRIQPEKRNAMLQILFEYNETDTILVMKRLMETLEATTTLQDYELNSASIAVSHTDGIALYDSFLNVEQLIRCCKSSSFIPFVTHESGMDFYNHKMAMDGFFYYNTFLNQYRNPPLVITPFMFGRYSNSMYNKLLFLLGCHPLKTTSIYQMYLYGYQDAKQNHSHFEKYLKPLPTV